MQGIRNYSTDWCIVQNNCWQDPLVTSIVNKAVQITGFPAENSEFIKISKFEQGHFYKLRIF